MIDQREIEALIRLFELSDWRALRLEVEGLALVLSDDADAALHQPSVAAPARPEAAPAAAPSASAPTGAGKAPQARADGLVEIPAPNLGTFYRGPKPGAAPYVEVGGRVCDETEVCLIEVMKLFTPVRAGVRGTVVRVCVEDGEMVEFGTPLFLVRPEAGKGG